LCSALTERMIIYLEVMVLNCVLKTSFRSKAQNQNLSINLFGQKLNSRYFNYFHLVYKSISLAHLFRTIWIRQMFIRFLFVILISQVLIGNAVYLHVIFIIIQKRHEPRLALAPAFLVLAIATRMTLPGFSSSCFCWIRRPTDWKCCDTVIPAHRETHS
jgi:hypothetical protein